MSKLSEITAQIEKELESKGKYMKLEDGAVKVLQFDPEQVKIVDKDFEGNGKFQRKVEYTVVDPEDEEGKEKILTMGLGNAKIINKKLERKQTLLEVERFGTGTKTKYSFTPVRE